MVAETGVEQYQPVAGSDEERAHWHERLAPLVDRAEERGALISWDILEQPFRADPEVPVADREQRLGAELALMLRRHSLVLAWLPALDGPSTIPVRYGGARLRANHLARFHQGAPVASVESGG